MRLWPAALLLVGCGSSSSQPNDSGHAEGESGVAAEDIPVTPEKPAPPGLTDNEKKELAALCNPIEPMLYEAGKKGMATLEGELGKGGDGAEAEKKALAAALAAVPQENLSPADHKRCLEIFGKEQKLRLYEYDPAEAAARTAVKSCVERVAASFGKQATVFDMEGSSEGASQGPFCPDDFPVPQSLKQLPYKSKAEDWENNTWRCLQFGLRGEQAFQIEYAAPVGAREFQCIARFLPRQGGAPIELVQGGKASDKGELLIGKKIEKRRMK
jgi:hypothetical protein